MRYVMSDLHGQYHWFLEMLERINFGSNDHLTILGDVVDRGPLPLEIVRHIKNSSNIELVKGNHEKMAVDILTSQDVFERAFWKQVNGGSPTWDAFERLNRMQQIELLDFLDTRPLYKVDGEYVMVHGGVRLSENDHILDVESVLAGQTESSLLWSFDENNKHFAFYNQPAFVGKILLFGHRTVWHMYQDVNGVKINPAVLWFDPIHQDKIGIDCGAGHPQRGGRLGCLCLDDMREFYVGVQD